MTSVVQRYSAAKFRKGSTIFLALFWFLGLLSGVLFFHASGSSFNSMMRSILMDTVSIVDLVSVAMLPFLLSAFAVFLSSPWLLLSIAFFRAFLLSFVSMQILAAFGSAGWLLRLLLLFSDLLSAPLFYLYIRWCLSSDFSHAFRTFFLIICCSILIGSLDYVYILPFLADVINS